MNGLRWKIKFIYLIAVIQNKFDTLYDHVSRRHSLVGGVGHRGIKNTAE